MLSLGNRVNYCYVKQDRGIHFRNLPAVSFGENLKAEKDTNKNKIPDPIYNFFHDLPKYELHAHFNGSTPLNICKMFFNKENKFIGVSESQLEDKYDDLRKNSKSLEEWLQKTYELKANNITTMDVMSAAYAIAMEEAKQNTRYLEIRIDPFSTHFVGSASDVIRAVETGFRNAQEDISEKNGSLKTGILLLAERHAPPEEAFKTARLATKLRSQRVLFEKMYGELKESESSNSVFSSSKTLNKAYFELKNILNADHLTEKLINDIHYSPNTDRNHIIKVLNNINSNINQNTDPYNNKLVGFDDILKLHKEVVNEKDHKISTMDIVPVTYSAILEQVKQGNRNITIAINPFNKLYSGNPEDILRSIQVGLRNAKCDLEKENIIINDSIVLEYDPSKVSSDEAKQIAKLTVKMKSQRVLFDKMYAELKASIAEDKIYKDSAVLTSIISDWNLSRKIKEKIEAKINHKNPRIKDIKLCIDEILKDDVKKFSSSTPKYKAEKVLRNFRESLDSVSKSKNIRSQLKTRFSATYKNLDTYINDKTSLSNKIFDNLKHLSKVKIDDIKDGTVNYDRYLRMGSGVIPNVKGLAVEKHNLDLSNNSLALPQSYIENYNERKLDAKDKVKLFPKLDGTVIRLKDVINNPDNYVCSVLYDEEIEDKLSNLDSFDESSISPVYSKEKISNDLNILKNIVANEANPDQYIKIELTRNLKVLADKIDTQCNMQERKFLLSKRIFDNLHHYSALRIKDRTEGSKEATRFARMGVNIIPNVVGYDIAGNENKFPALLHEKALKHIKYYNETKQNPDDELKVTVHAGEVKQSGKTKEEAIPGWKNIEFAIKMGAHRIGHGIDLRNAPEELKDEARKRFILMETCPKVNYQTGSVEGYRDHPVLDFLDTDIPANINTDNPVTADTDITNEYVELFKHFNSKITPKERAQGVNERLTLGHIKKIIHNSIWSAFGLNAQEKVAEERYAMNQVDTLVKKYSDKIVLNDNEPILLKAQKQIIAFTGNFKKALAKHLNVNKVA